MSAPEGPTPSGSVLSCVLDHLEAAWLASLHVADGLPEDVGYVIFKAGEAIKRHRGPERVDVLVGRATA